MLRRKTIKRKVTLEAIHALEAQLYPAIVGLRATAREAALGHAAKFFGGRLPDSGIPGRLLDIDRAKSYSANTSKLGIDLLGKGDQIAKQLDRRLAQIAVTENANAYNLEHRNAVIDTADGLGLVEVWDSELDKRTCEVCMSLDGSLAIDGSFDGGQIPGAVHPWCRCTSHFVRRSILH